MAEFLEAITIREAPFPLVHEILVSVHEVWAITIFEVGIVGPCAMETDTIKSAIIELKYLNISNTKLMISQKVGRLYLLLKSYSCNYTQRQDLMCS